MVGKRLGVFMVATLLTASAFVASASAEEAVRSETKLGAPWGLVATAEDAPDGNGTLVRLTWQRPLEGDGGSIDEYRVYRSSDLGSMWLPIGRSQAREFVDTIGTDNVVAIVSYVVTAANVTGESEASQEAYVINPRSDASCISFFSFLPPEVRVDWKCLGIGDVVCIPPVGGRITCRN